MLLAARRLSDYPSDNPAGLFSRVAHLRFSTLEKPVLFQWNGYCEIQTEAEQEIRTRQLTFMGQILQFRERNDAHSDLSVESSSVKSTRPPRVAVVLTQLTRGGAEKQTYELLRRLRHSPSRPALVISLSRKLAPYGTMIEELGYPLAVIERWGSFDPFRVLQLRRMLHSNRIEVVHAINLHASAYCWFATAMGRKISFLPSLRGSVRDPGVIRTSCYRQMLNSCPRCLVNSHRGAQSINRKLGTPGWKLKVIPNGVDFEELRARSQPAQLRKLLGLTSEDRIVGYIGKDSKVKNPSRFLEIAKKLQAEDDSIHCVLIGQKLGPEAREELGCELPPERTHFLGERQDIPSLLIDFDVLLLTSDSEGCPNVVLEAQGLGVPVVASDVGDVADIVEDGVSGAVVPAEDIRQYVTATREYLMLGRFGRDRTRRRWRELERKFGMEAMVMETERLWSELWDLNEDRYSSRIRQVQ